MPAEPAQTNTSRQDAGPAAGALLPLSSRLPPAAAREPLPLLQASAAALGLPLTDGQLQAFARYQDALIAANRQVNLTAIADPEDVEIKHFVDSLTGLLAWSSGSSRPLRVIDVGTGAGFPGLPLKLACPDLTLSLVESVGKKMAFVAQIVALLGLTGVELHTARAEELGQQPGHREQYDVALTRAVGRLPVLLEYALPLLRPGGRLIAYKTRSAAVAEVQQSEAARAKLGGGPPSIVPVQLRAGDVPSQAASVATVQQALARRVLVVVPKQHPTPPTFPRRSGIPAKRPL